MDINLQSVSVVDTAGAKHAHVEKIVDDKQERISLRFAETFKAKAGPIKLALAWEAKLGASMVGEY